MEKMTQERRMAVSFDMTCICVVKDDRFAAPRYGQTRDQPRMRGLDGFMAGRKVGMKCEGIGELSYFLVCQDYTSPDKASSVRGCSP